MQGPCKAIKGPYAALQKHYKALVGSGKTLIMVRMIDNFYYDERAKITIVPKDVVVDNFYLSLWEWPSRWRDFCCWSNPHEAAMAAGTENWRHMRDSRWQLTSENASIRREAEAKNLTLDKLHKDVLVKIMRATLEMKGAIYQGKLRADV